VAAGIGNHERQESIAEFHDAPPDTGKTPAAHLAGRPGGEDFAAGVEAEQAKELDAAEDGGPTIEGKGNGSDDPLAGEETVDLEFDSAVGVPGGSDAPVGSVVEDGSASDYPEHPYASEDEEHAHDAQEAADFLDLG